MLQLHSPDTTTGVHNSILTQY